MKSRLLTEIKKKNWKVLQKIIENNLERENSKCRSTKKRFELRELYCYEVALKFLGPIIRKDGIEAMY